MKFGSIKVAALVALSAALSLSPAAAGPAPLDSVQLISTGRMNDLIGSLMNRNDAESYNLRSRAYYATEQWDPAIENAERAVSLRENDAQYHLWLGTQGQSGIRARGGTQSA